MRVYVLTADIYEEMYGSQIVLCGTFRTYEKAEKAANELKLRFYKIHESIIDEVIAKYLGGYNE